LIARLEYADIDDVAVAVAVATCLHSNVRHAVAVAIQPAAAAPLDAAKTVDVAAAACLHSKVNHIDAVALPAVGPSLLDAAKAVGSKDS
jgi:hypothetical protein